MNSRVSNTIPNSRRSNDSPISRISSFQTGRTGDDIIPGSPIGLLLVLTYSERFTSRTYGEFRPTSRIVNV